MTQNDILVLLAASVLLLLAHIARSLRWALLLKPHRFQRFSLLMGLALGYAANTLIPFRLGEVLRAFYVSQQERIRFSYVAASVVTERIADLAVVGLVGGILALIGGAFDVALTAAAMLIIAALLVAFGFACRVSKRARRTVWWVASIFSDKVRFGIVDAVWSFGEMIRGGVLFRWRFLLSTVLMWILYAGSYMLFGRVVGEVLGETLYALLGTPLTPLATSLFSGGFGSRDWLLLLFNALPLLAVIVYGFARQRTTIIRLLAAVREYGGVPNTDVPVRSRERFKREGEYEYFLASLFSGDDHTVAGFGLRAVEDGTVHRLFNGGSDAITALVEVNEHLVIRKFALGAPADKLKVQSDWLTTNKGTGLSLVDVVDTRKEPGFFRYDMPLVVPATDFYDVIHTVPIDRSRAVLSEVTGQINRFHQHNGKGEAPDGVIRAYLDGKAIGNARKIIEFAETMLPSARYRINDVEHDLADWKRLTDPSWLSAQIRDHRIAAVHGDLTIENIIVSPTTPDGWYIIDPNPENVFDTPLIDWAKLMQSLHLGYEGLNRGVLCSLSDDAIRLSFTRSHAYSTLHEELERAIGERYGADGLREVYFHELINYLRLTPYKIRQDTLKGLTFFACTSILLKRYMERAL